MADPDGSQTLEGNGVLLDKIPNEEARMTGSLLG